MKTYFLPIAISLFFFVSCGMEDTQNKGVVDTLEETQQNSSSNEITACGVQQPAKNLPWLADLIAKAKTDKTGNYIGVIWLERYKDQDVFVTNMMLGSGGLAYHVFDCMGNQMTIDRTDEMSFFNHLKKDIVVYVHPDYHLI